MNFIKNEGTNQPTNKQTNKNPKVHMPIIMREKKKERQPWLHSLARILLRLYA